MGVAILYHRTGYSQTRFKTNDSSPKEMRREKHFEYSSLVLLQAPNSEDETTAAAHNNSP